MYRKVIIVAAFGIVVGTTFGVFNSPSLRYVSDAEASTVFGGCNSFVGEQGICIDPDDPTIQCKAVVYKTGTGFVKPKLEFCGTCGFQQIPTGQVCSGS